jgi:hypothetical protein
LVEENAMSEQELEQVLNELSKAIFRGRVRHSTLFVSTGVTYPNGVETAVRIDRNREGFVVSDDGYASRIAETMGAASTLSRLAPGVSARSGISFERGTFFLSDVSRESLPVAIGAVANSSSRSIERVLALIGQPRLRRSRELFDKRLREAFGKNIVFDLEFRGATGRNWEFDAGIERDGLIVRLFELVSPSTQAVAIANMKISDTRAVPEPPSVVAALVDYERTDPALRAILSSSGGTVIAANDDVSRYRLSAA